MQFTEGKIGRVFVLQFTSNDQLPTTVENFVREHGIAAGLVNFSNGGVAMIALDDNGARLWDYALGNGGSQTVNNVGGAVAKSAVIYEILGAEFANVTKDGATAQLSEPAPAPRFAVPAPQRNDEFTQILYVFNAELN